MDLPTGPAPATPLARAAGQARSYGSGLLFCGVIALASSFIARVHGGPPVLYALLFGLAFHFLHDDARLRQGLQLCSGLLLRLGVALLGTRITLEQVAALGWQTVALVAAAVASTILGGLWLARRLGLSAAQGVLSGGATAICGASAALAIAAALPRSRETERFTVLVVAAVTGLSTLAMLLYPVIAHLAHLSPAEAGLFIGGSIHDVAQVVAAGYLVGPQTGDVATLVKLLRVAMLVLVVAAVSLAVGARLERVAQGDAPTEPRDAAARPALVPWFLWLFVALVLLQSLHLIPSAALPALADTSRACLLLAIAALGVRTSLQQLMHTGWRALLLLVAETAWLATALLVAIVAARAS